MFFAQDFALDLISRIVVLGPLCLVIVIVVTRVIGLRSFSKMTAFDFISTVAIGSLLASAATASDWEAFLQGSLSIPAILVAQALLATMRKNSSLGSSLIENQPVLLVEDGHWNEAAFRQSRVAHHDVWAKLREANVCEIGKVRAVVLETTGDISVLHCDTLDEKILTGVKRMKKG